MPRPRHANKEIEAAVKFAEAHGWSYVRAGSHSWGILHCPGQGRDGHRFSVYSTPTNPYTHSEKIRRAVKQCNHREES